MLKVYIDLRLLDSVLIVALSMLMLSSETLVQKDCFYSILILVRFHLRPTIPLQKMYKTHVDLDLLIVYQRFG